MARPGLCVWGRKQGRAPWLEPCSPLHGSEALAGSGLPVAAAATSHLVPRPPSGPEGWARGPPAICLLGAGCFRKAAGRLREPWLLEEALEADLWPGQPVRPQVAMGRPASGPNCPHTHLPGPRSPETQPVGSASYHRHCCDLGEGPASLLSGFPSMQWAGWTLRPRLLSSYC